MMHGQRNVKLITRSLERRRKTTKISVFEVLTLVSLKIQVLREDLT